ncbi:SIS domain-containing protein [Candidatus Falkowbacteria bacterium]|nr:SIS domain-containing protein [Candidatus Falkowbacteria bacterium]
MSSILDNLEKIKKLDKNKVAPSIELLYGQIRQVMEEARLIKIPQEYSRAKKIVVNGMGASNLGAGIVKAVFADKVNAPIIIAPGYEVPAFVDADTLYIISSYSGNTEEPLFAYRQAKKRGAKIAAITAASDNTLKKIMINDNVPGYIFKDERNPSGISRYGLGYSIFGIAIILAKAGFLKIKVKEVEKIIGDLEIWDHKLRPNVPCRMNIAKQLAEKLCGRQTVAVAAEFLQGNLRALRNQFCETGKNFAGYLILPEFNHYAMEGLSYPKSNRQNLVFFFFDSNLYHPRVRKRSALSKEVVRKNKIKVVEYKLRGGTKLEQTFEMLQLGSWITFYLAVLNGVNPGPNPWVDWFKKRLG